MIPRRTIEELIARYELEPTLKDIYVEGYSDKILLEWFLSHTSIEDVIIYEISTVEVPYERIRELRLEDNNRGRVIALAFALHSGASIDLTNTLACIADTDFDNLLGKKYECPILIFTGYTAIELYLYNADVIGKYLGLVITNFPYDAAVVLEAMTSTLTELFLIRIANQELKFGIEPLPLDKFCTIENGQVLFDRDKYIVRYLNKGAKLSDRGSFEEFIETIRVRLTHDPRMHIHGHDFINLLHLYITKIKKPKRAIDMDFFARSLFGVIEIGHLGREPLFQELMRRFT
jgi:hypothetical protein